MVRHKKPFFSHLMVLIVPLLCILSPSDLFASNKLTLQNKGVSLGHLAGYYMAVKKGFYAQEGLEVQIKGVPPDTNVPRDVQPFDARPIVVGLLIVSCLLIIALYIYSLNRRLSLKITELNNTLEELSKSESRYRVLAENTTDVIWTMDVQGRFTYISPSVFNLRGYTAKEVMAQTPEEALTPRSRAVYFDGLKLMAETVSKGLRLEPSVYELEQPCKDGSTVWTEATINGIYDDEGKLIGIVGVTRDITDRRANEEKLRLLSEVVEQSPYGIVVSNAQGNIEYVNERFLETNTLSKDAVIGAKHKEVIASLCDPLRDISVTWASARTGFRWQTERQFKDKMGQMRHEAITVAPLKSQDGNITHIISIHHDITERKALEAEIQGLLHTIETIGDNLPNSFVYQTIKTYPDINRRYTYISKGIRDIVGIEPHEALQDANKVYERIYPEDIELFLKAEKETIENKKETFAIDVRGYDIAGNLKWFRVQASYRYNDDGRTITVNGIVTDITHYKEIEMELEAARQEAINAAKAKGEFLANMSHEIRTPLHSIIGYTELLKGLPLSREAMDYLENMTVAESALMCLINDILDFSKIEAGKMQLYLDEVDVIELLEQTIEVVCLQAYQKGLELIFHVSPKMPKYGHLDAVRLRQVLINLLSNAVKFTDEGEIELRADFRPINDREGIFEFSVRDTGIGISEAYQRHIFEGFVQIDNYSTRKHTGTGLGLAISESLVRMMGSSIALKSKLGEGSTFSFSVKTAYRAEPCETPPILSGQIKAMVLVANNTVRKNMEDNLMSLSIATYGCADLREAIHVAKENSDIEVLIVEYKQLSDEGLEALRGVVDAIQNKPTGLKTILLVEPTMVLETRYAPVWLGELKQLVKPIRPSRLYRLLFGHQCPSCTSSDQTSTQTSIPLKILITEDVPMNMVIIERLIGKIIPEAKIFKATTGREAVDEYINSLPDIVFMDVQMPEMDGITATRLIREYEARLQRSTKIVALTAGITDSERQRCIDAGMDHFLGKPIDIAALRGVLQP